MIIEWVSADELDGATRFPHGYWLARTNDGGWDGTGPDPLTAVSNLAAALERSVR